MVLRPWFTLNGCLPLNLMKLKYLSVIVISLLLIGCDPVKRVLRDETKFDEVAQEMVRRGYCVNDTIVVTKVKDSVVYKDSIVQKLVNVPCKDFDTTIGRARIKVSSGVLTYTAADSVVIRKETITNTVRDRKLEDILKKDISSRDQQIDSLKLSVRSSQTENKELKADLRWFQIKFWALFVAALVIIFRKSLIRLVGGFI